MTKSKTPARSSAKIAAKKSATKTAAKPSKKVEVEKPKVYFAPPTPRAGDDPTHPVVNAKCRRGQDKQTEGQACQSLSAENMTPTGSNTIHFRCVKCKYDWRVPMGGTFQGV